MRTIKKLLTIVKKNINLMEDKALAPGLCAIIKALYNRDIITFVERDLLNEYLNNNKPANAIRRYKTKLEDEEFAQFRFWFKPCSIPPRLRWLDKQINSL